MQLLIKADTDDAPQPADHATSSDAVRLVTQPDPAAVHVGMRKSRKAAKRKSSKAKKQQSEKAAKRKTNEHACAYATLMRTRNIEKH